MDLSFGARFTFPVNGNPFSFDITYATAPTRTLTIAPTSAQESLSLADAIKAVAAMIGTVSSTAQADINALVNFLTSPPMSEAPWSKLLTQDVTPSLTLSSEKGNATCSLVLTLDPPLTIGGSTGWGGFSISIEPAGTLPAVPP